MGRLKDKKEKVAKKATKKASLKKQPKKVKKQSKPSKPFKNTTKKLRSSKKNSVKQLELEILSSTTLLEEDNEDEEQKPHRVAPKDMLEQIMFRLPCVPDPLVGTPQQVQKELDSLAKKIQREPSNDAIFDKIHLYMHGYLINVVLKKFPFIRGLQSVDIYQETLIALKFKAIPNFKRNKGMSFLNFAKMCIRRHLITLLNASKNRQKDQSINRAISLDSSPLSNSGNDDDSRNTYVNIITDGKICVDKALENNEAYDVTKNTLFNALSEFEQIVLNEYLSSSSYREISKNLSKKTGKRHNIKSIDNALLRIRKKAMQLKKYSKFDELPIFLPKEKK